MIIAVLDGGVDYNHPDLDPGDRSRIIAGIDTGDDDNDPFDDLPDHHEDSFAGHGTAIAGLIGSITDNGMDGSGVMWNCQIMPIKMVRSGELSLAHPGGNFTLWDFSWSVFPSDAADAIDYAVNNGADIINLSYGFPDLGEVVNDVILRVPLLFDALDNAYRNNVLITASMGNEGDECFSYGCNPYNYPAGFSEIVLGVGATDGTGLKADFSSYGPHINLSAPGTFIRSTKRDGEFGFVGKGTSYSAPIVAGVAGLVLSQGKDRGFELTNDDLRNILERTATDVPDYGIGFDEQTGHGIVNAHHALELLDEPNELYHWTAGGDEEFFENRGQWNLLSGRWGLAAGTYYDVDVYKVEKTVYFDIPFCEPPAVWMRNRESETISGANPNDGKPWSSITNITETGFDLKYFTYFVRTNASGQEINKWVPATPSESNLEYTAVGRPNLAGTAGPITGPALTCKSDVISYHLNNVPPSHSVSWTVSNNFSIIGGQGTANISLLAQAANETAWVSVTLQGECGEAVLPNLEVKVPEIPQESEMTFNRTSSYNFSNGRWNVLGVHYGNLGITLDKFRWEWNVPSSIISKSDPMASYINFRPQTTASSIYIRARACNECDECSDWHGQWFNIRSGSGTPCDDSSGLPCRDDEVEY